jgi:hypothetical protein
MENVGKLLLGLGVALVVVGGAVWGLARLGFKGLPGDVKYESDRVRVYFPIVTCLVISLVATGVMWLVQWFRNR